MPGYLTLHIFAGTPRLGLWCPKCLLPSGAEVDLFSVTMAGVTPMGTFRRCTECLKPVERQPDD